jgi:hypothetical protein
MAKPQPLFAQPPLPLGGPAIDARSLAAHIQRICDDVATLHSGQLRRVREDLVFLVREERGRNGNSLRADMLAHLAREISFMFDH